MKPPILAALKLDIEDASSAGLLSTLPLAVVEKDIHITEVQADIVDYIVGFYNSVRLHSTLGYWPHELSNPDYVRGLLSSLCLKEILR